MARQYASYAPPPRSEAPKSVGVASSPSGTITVSTKNFNRSSRRTSGGGGSSSPPPRSEPPVSSPSVEEIKAGNIPDKKIEQQQRVQNIQQAQTIQRQLQDKSKQGPSADPFLQERVIDQVKTKSGQKVPVTDVFYFDPRTREERIATKEEREFFRSQPNELIAGQDKPTRIQQVLGGGNLLTGYNRVKTGVGEFSGVISDINRKTGDIIGASVSKPLKVVERKTGLNLPTSLEEAGSNIKQSSDFLRSKGIPEPTIKVNEVIAQAGLGLAEDVRQKPLKNIALFGAGKVAGLGVSGVSSLGLRTGGLTGGRIVKGGLNVAGLGLTGVYGAEVFRQYQQAPSDKRAGIVGVAIKDLGVTGFGFTRGQKTFTKLSGNIRTLGRDFIPIEKLTRKEVLTGQKNFPTAPREQQLGMFQRQGFGYSAKPTPIGLKAPKGKSEFAGLYLSTELSPYFFRGGGETKIFNLKSIFEPSGQPTALKIFPKGFRYAPYRRIPNRPKKPFGYEFIQAEKKGVAEVPLLKTEIEAIIRPNTQLKPLKSQYFTEYQGVKIPIQEYTLGNPIKNIKSPKPRLRDIFRGRSSTSSKGFLPTYSVINPQSLALGLYSSRVKSSTRNYKPVSYKSSLVSRGSKTTPKSSVYSLLSSSGYSPLSSYNSFISNLYSGGSSAGYNPFSRISPQAKQKPKRPKRERVRDLLGGKPSKLFQPTRYTPSLTGVVFKIRGKPLGLGKAGFLPSIRGLEPKKKSKRKSFL